MLRMVITAMMIERMRIVVRSRIIDTLYRAPGRLTTL
jgi:hypothetical protein